MGSRPEPDESAKVRPGRGVLESKTKQIWGLGVQGFRGLAFRGLGA